MQIADQIVLGDREIAIHLCAIAPLANQVPPASGRAGFATALKPVISPMFLAVVNGETLEPGVAGHLLSRQDEPVVGIALGPSLRGTRA